MSLARLRETEVSISSAGMCPLRLLTLEEVHCRVKKKPCGKIQVTKLRDASR